MVGFELDRGDIQQPRLLDKEREIELFQAPGGASEISFYILKIRDSKFLLSVAQNYLKAEDGLRTQWIIEVIDMPKEWGGDKSALTEVAKEALTAYKNSVYKKELAVRKDVFLREPEVLFSQNRMHPLVRN